MVKAWRIHRQAFLIGKLYGGADKNYTIKFV
jgi:hypothetical protein